MDIRTLEETTSELVVPGKGLLAEDESFGTLGKRCDALGIESSEENRRAYREMLFTTEGIGEFLSGVILFEETLHQETSDGTPMTEVLTNAGVMPGIKVD
jgi:fructose-bisphosphate aldolase class I